MQKFPSRPRNVIQKDKFLFITTNLSDVCLSICRFRRVITHCHANHFGLVSFQHPYSRPPFNPFTVRHPRGRTFILSYTQLFAPSFFNITVGRFFFSPPFVTSVSFPVPATLSTEPAFESFHFFPGHF